MSWPRPCPNCGSAIPVSPPGELEKHIAELEVERDYEHATAGEIADLADVYRARAEKAEAEVERAERHHSATHYDCDFTHDGVSP